MKTLAFLIMAGLLVSGCGASDGPVNARLGSRGELSQWRAQDWTDYRFDFARHCFCVPEALEPVTIEVSGGRISAVRSRRTGEELPRTASAPWYTIEELFRLVRDAERAGVRPLRVRYHPLGYPAEIELGTLASDAGVRYSVENVVPLD